MIGQIGCTVIFPAFKSYAYCIYCLQERQISEPPSNFNNNGQIVFEEAPSQPLPPCQAQNNVPLFQI